MKLFMFKVKLILNYSKQKEYKFSKYYKNTYFLQNNGLYTNIKKKTIGSIVFLNRTSCSGVK